MGVRGFDPASPAERRGDRRQRAVVVTMLAALAFGAVGCGWITHETDARAPEPTLEGGMRTVPTVPPTTVLATDASGVGVDGAGAPTEPRDAGIPSSTVYVGDVPPDPDGGDELPPPETVPGQVPPACDRLAAGGVGELVGTAAGTPATAEPIGDGACRFAAGSVVAEVHFLSERAVNDDWFRRDGIEPAGDVGSDVVGIAAFEAPGSESSDGYTFALVSAREGAVVAVRGTDAARDLAVSVALATQQAIQ